MKFTIAELEREAIDFNESLAPGTVDFVDDIRQAAPLHTSGHVDLLEEHRGPRDIVEDIRIRGTLATVVEVPCARCLDPVEQPVEAAFDLLFRPLVADMTAADRAITTSETEIGYYEGDGLLLEDVLREQILLALPARILCREDCKGICPDCGRNRNTDACDCGSATIDPRWSSLQTIGVSAKQGARRSNRPSEPNS